MAAGGSILAFSCMHSRFLLFHLRPPTSQTLHAESYFPTELPCLLQVSRLGFPPSRPHTHAFLLLCSFQPGYHSATLVLLLSLTHALQYSFSPPFPLSPSWDLSAFPEPPPWGVHPCRSCRNPGHCLCQQIYGKKNKLLKKEVDSSTYYLLSRAASMQALGTTTA